MVMTLYLVIGAIVFSEIEEETEIKSKRQTQLKMKEASEEAITKVVNLSVSSICNQTSWTLDQCINSVDKREVHKTVFQLVSVVRELHFPIYNFHFGRIFFIRGLELLGNKE